jgi:hypothetical protein
VWTGGNVIQANRWLFGVERNSALLKRVLASNNKMSLTLNDNYVSWWYTESPPVRVGRWNV